MGAEMIRQRLIVRGRVQGVFFRDFTRAAATRERVAGWAANRPDGTVEVVLEGAPDAVATVTRACRQGPPQAEVQSVEVVEQQPEGLDGFVIR
ncbi:MAG: acylphosphatase [Solirubrobacteraceae bacterium]